MADYNYEKMGCPEYIQDIDEIDYNTSLRGEWIKHPVHGVGVVIGNCYEMIYVCFGGGKAEWLNDSECEPAEIPEGLPISYYPHHWQAVVLKRRATQLESDEDRKTNALNAVIVDYVKGFFEHMFSATSGHLAEALNKHYETDAFTSADVNHALIERTDLFCPPYVGQDDKPGHWALASHPHLEKEIEPRTKAFKAWLNKKANP